MPRKKMSEYPPEVAAKMRADISEGMRRVWRNRNSNGLGTRKNGALQLEVQKSISDSVKKRWEEGEYNNRENGMLGRFFSEHHNWQWGVRQYRDILTQFEERKCVICGRTEDESKIDAHHIDEDRKNYLLSNLVWTCVPCHYHVLHKVTTRTEGGARRVRLRRPFVSISKKFKFEYSHILPWHPGKCSQLHGHSGKLKVELKARLDCNDVVADFYDVGQVVKMSVIKELDHRFLNDYITNPTSEAMLFWIWHELEKAGLKGLNKLTFSETDSSSATISKADVLEAFGWDMLSDNWTLVEKVEDLDVVNEVMLEEEV